MMSSGKRRSRSELVERKHSLEGEINVLSMELERRRSSGQRTTDLEARLDLLRNRHHRTRLEIDRTAPDN